MLFILLVCIVAGVCNGSKLDTLVNRMRRLEIRLAEDITQLRQELYDELDQVQGNNDLDLTSHADTSQNVYNITHAERLLANMELFKSEMDTKIQYLLSGQQQEKRVVRSLRDGLQMALESNIEKTGLLQNILRNMSEEAATSIKQTADRLEEQLKAIQILLNSSDTLTQKPVVQPTRFNDCSDLLRHGHVSSGVYTIYPDTLWRPLHVYCDMTTDGGGWTVFQRRMDGSENFERLWIDYTFGFGNLEGEFWLGNEFIHRLTSGAPHELRIELEDFENERMFAEYGLFSVGPSSDLFRLSLEYFTGNVADSMSGHTGEQFSTKDKGPSSSCAVSYKGGFWYNKCHAVNINGLYLKGEHKSYANGVNWSGWKGYHYSLKRTELKFRPK